MNPVDLLLTSSLRFGKSLALLALLGLWVGSFVVPAAASAPPVGAPSAPTVGEMYEWGSRQSSCRLDPSILAAIGGVVSDHGTAYGRRVDSEGRVSPPLIGEALNGLNGRAFQADTDHGVLDEDPAWDRTVGLFQFLPRTWLRYGYDANNDGLIDPQNVWDAAASAAEFLCSYNVQNPEEQRHAIRTFTGTDAQSAEVLAVLETLPAADERPSRNIDIIVDEGDLTGVSDVVFGVENPPEAAPDQDQRTVDAHFVVDDDLDINQVEYRLTNEDVLRAVTTDSLGDRVGNRRLGRIGDRPVHGIFSGGVTFAVFRTIGDVSTFVSGKQRFAVGNVGDQMFVGDWDGDGIHSPASFDPTTGLVTLHGSAGATIYGARIPVQEGHTVLVGDWDGDGVDTIATASPDPDSATVTSIRYLNEQGHETHTELSSIPTSQMATIRRDAFQNHITPKPTPASQPNPQATPDGANQAPAIKDDREVSPYPIEQGDTITVANNRTIQLARVNNITVNNEIAPELAALLAHAHADGIKLDGWGWRSHQRQIELREQNCPDIWATPASSCRPPTAIPGTSRHEIGRAIDFHVDGQVLTKTSPAFLWLVDNAETYGFANLPSEPWHWSDTGG